jgi:hypothetical protein
MENTENNLTSQLEIVTNVLNVTRDQLSKSMNLNAELEGIIMFERKRSQELEKELEELRKSSAKK